MRLFCRVESPLENLQFSHSHRGGGPQEGCGCAQCPNDGVHVGVASLVAIGGRFVRKKMLLIILAKKFFL